MPTTKTRSARVLPSSPIERVRAQVASARARNGAERSGAAGGVGAPPSGAGSSARANLDPASWHYAKHVSALLSDADDVRKTRRHLRHAQRSVLWDVSTLKRVKTCGRTPIGPTGDVLIRDNAGVAHYVGLSTCGSIWACPVCSAKIRNTRAEEIAEATGRWMATGNSVYAVTLTTPHDYGDRLKALLGAISDGFRSVISGRAWLADKKACGIVGTIRSLEVTHGANGWHPHLHVLLYVTGTMGTVQHARLVSRLRERWSRHIVKSGFRAPSGSHGVRVELVEDGEAAGLYLAKTQDGKSIANEMTRADLKSGRNGGRTPFEILDDFRHTGDAAALSLWNEYEKATKGRQCITWSKGLRDVLKAAEDRTDEEIAAEEIGGEDVALISGETWRGIAARPGMTAAVLDAAEAGGLDGVNALLALHGIGAALPPPELSAPPRCP